MDFQWTQRGRPMLKGLLLERCANGVGYKADKYRLGVVTSWVLGKEIG